MNYERNFLIQRKILYFNSSTTFGTDPIYLDSNQESIWASEAQIGSIFGRDRSVVYRHINNIYKEGELIKKSTCAKIAQVQKEGDREITREINQYNLDVIISVGYRVKSPLATEFRKYLSKIIKVHLVKGYSISN